jgi:hypothetical protein
MSAPVSDNPGYTYIEKTVTRKGKTYKQWFKVKVKGALAAAPPKKASEVVAQHVKANGGAGVGEPQAKGAAAALEGAKRKLAEAKAATAADRLMTTQVGGQKGSNEGGTYIGADGKQRYVKFYKDPTQAASEQLALKIYKDLGHDVPHTELFEHGGKKGIASEIVPGMAIKEHISPQDPAWAKDISRTFLKGFTTDVLTANWDAAGLAHDNVIADGSGKTTRIDVGGSFLRRAQGAPKPAHMVNEIKEWEGFFDPKINPSYSKLAQLAGVKKAEDLGDQLHQDLAKITKLEKKHGNWEGYVKNAVPELANHPAELKGIVTMLESRSKLLREKIQAIPPGDPGAGYKYVQRDVLRKGKTYKQWFKVKDKEAADLAKAKKLRLVAPKKVLSRDEMKSEIEKLKTDLNHSGKGRYDDPSMAFSGVAGAKYGQLREEGNEAYSKIKGTVMADAIQAFTGSSYRAIRALQLKQDHPEEFQKGVDEGWIGKYGLDSAAKYLKPLQHAQEAMSIHEPTQHGKLHRGMNVSREQLHAMLTGDSITHNGYSTNSTSYSRSIAENFQRSEKEPSHSSEVPKEYPVMLTYAKVKKGANMMYDQNHNIGEQEIALGKGTFKILSKRFVETVQENKVYGVKREGYFEFELAEHDD